MNMSQKCNCCVHEAVCENKTKYQAVLEILREVLNDNRGVAECEVKCPHFMPKQQTGRDCE